MLFGLEIPAVTHLPGEHLGDQGKSVGVVDLPCRIFDTGDGGDLAHVVGLDAYEGHHTRVPHSACVPPRDFRADVWSSHDRRCYSDDVASAQRRSALLLGCRSEAH